VRPETDGGISPVGESAQLRGQSKRKRLPWILDSLRSGVQAKLARQSLELKLEAVEQQRRILCAALNRVKQDELHASFFG